MGYEQNNTYIVIHHVDTIYDTRHTCMKKYRSPYDNRPCLKQSYLAPEERRAQILNEAVKIATKHGYTTLTRNNVAEAAGVTNGLVSHYFGSINGLKDAVVQKALSDSIFPILAQAILAKDPNVSNISQSLKRRAMLAACI